LAAAMSLSIPAYTTAKEAGNMVLTQRA
jgi:hypothetical protein